MRPWSMIAISTIVSACSPTSAPTTTAADGPPSSAQHAPHTSGLVLLVEMPPAGATLRVDASDDRAPLIRTRPLAARQHLDVAEGFINLVVQRGDSTTELGIYVRPGATLTLDGPSVELVALDRAVAIDRAAAEAQWSANMHAMMEAVANWDGQAPFPDEARALLEHQAAALDEFGDPTTADLLRLRQAAFVAQLTGPGDAWALMRDIPPDSPAFAAYSPWMLELSWLLRDVPEAAGRLDEVRAVQVDIGLRSAFKSFDLLRAEREGDALAPVYAAATEVDGPLVVGEAMPAFEFPRLDGRGAIRSGDLLGQPYLIEVWSTWCEPCIEQMDSLHARYESAAETDPPRLQIVSVAINETREPVLAFREERWSMPWPNAWVPDGTALRENWGIGGVPFAVLVDSRGILRAADSKISDEQLDAVTLD